MPRVFSSAIATENHNRACRTQSIVRVRHESHSEKCPGSSSVFKGLKKKRRKKKRKNTQTGYSNEKGSISTTCMQAKSEFERDVLQRLCGR